MTTFQKKTGIGMIAKEPVKFTIPLPDFSQAELTKVLAFHKSMTGYSSTPLQRLDTLAKRLDVAGVYVKDESYRFGLNAYKGLGGIYAVARVICRELGLDIAQTSFADLQQPERMERICMMTFVTATDGNHGNGIAWSASQFGCKSYVYMPKGSSERRAEAIRRNGASQVEITDMRYDDVVRFAAKTAEENDWFLVQDTAWEGYTEIPIWIAQGYTTIATEVYEELEQTCIPNPTHVFLQAGVGSLASGIAGYLYNRFPDNCPAIAIVEPDTMACIYRSISCGDGAPHAVTTESTTIMAGLNCGDPSVTAWPILRDIPSYYIACEDFVAARGMRYLGHPTGNDPQVIAGESGAVGLGLLTMIMEKDDLAPIRESMGLNSESVVLLISTEGNTDPEMYDKIVFDGYCPSF